MSDYCWFLEDKEALHDATPRLFGDHIAVVVGVRGARRVGLFAHTWEVAVRYAQQQPVEAGAFIWVLIRGQWRARDFPRRVESTEKGDGGR